MVDEAAHVLAADQRDVLAEFVAVEFEQALAVLALFLGHLGEDIGAGRVLGPQAFGDIDVDAVVLFLVGDRQREDLPLGQVGEVAHAAPMWRMRRAGQGVGTPRRADWRAHPATRRALPAQV